jgi:hypothetical protein
MLRIFENMIVKRMFRPKRGMEKAPE